MLIIRGVNVFPSQIETALLRAEKSLPHYQIVVDHRARWTQSKSGRNFPRHGERQHRRDGKHHADAQALGTDHKAFPWQSRSANRALPRSEGKANASSTTRPQFKPGRIDFGEDSGRFPFRFKPSRAHSPSADSRGRRHQSVPLTLADNGEFGLTCASYRLRCGQGRLRAGSVGTRRDSHGCHRLQVDCGPGGLSKFLRRPRAKCR